MRQGSRFVRCALATAAAMGAALAASPAQAQPTHDAPRPGPAYKAQPLNLQKEKLGSAGLSDVALSRMRSGDCAGALEAFDAALRTLTDPALYRDRGLCHEQLGHVYPAIDDYRAYLTEMPEAPDADGISARLRRLEDQAAGRPPSSTPDSDDSPPGLRASVTLGSKGASATAKGGGRATDKLEYVEPDEDAVRTPLRAGKGWSLAPFLAVHKWFFDGTDFFDAQTLSESVGLQARYSIGPSGALVIEAGYEHFNSTSVDPATIYGLTSQVAWEFRFALDPDYDNQLLVMPGLGYEHIVVTPTTADAQTQTKGAFVPRVRFGWRHMIQVATALDLSLDAGIGNFFDYSTFPFDSNAPMTGLLALNASVAWGL